MLLPEKSCCAFLHFSENDEIPYYVQIYCNELSKYFDEIVLVSNNKNLDLNKSFSSNIRLWHTENKGYDFGLFYRFLKSINLSESVYNQRNAAAAAVASHEVGHAVQHAKAYEWLQLRSKLVPTVSVTSKLSQWLVIGGIILGAASGNTGIGFIIAIIGLGFMALATIFSFITLPVEYDASNRAFIFDNSYGEIPSWFCEIEEFDTLKWRTKDSPAWFKNAFIDKVTFDE